MTEIIVADLTTLRVDGIVNAANEALAGGGGVDGAIHRAAGPELLEACRQLPQAAEGVRCPTGSVRITPGFALSAAWVLHTAGPVWQGGGHGEADLLAACYRNALAVARAYGLRTLAFPAISAGVYGYPPDQAAAIARRHLDEAAGAFDRLIACCFDETMADYYRQAG